MHRSMLQRIQACFSCYIRPKNNPKLRRVPVMRKRIDLSTANKELKFPVRIPLKYRYVYTPVQRIYREYQKTIQWERLRPNENLLAFEDLNRLTKEEIFAGLERLAQQPGQENYDWQAHPWINAAFEDIKKNWEQYKERKHLTLRLYKLMRNLRNKDPEMQKFVEDKVSAQIHLMSLKEFIYFWEKYYNDNNHFTPEFRQDLFKLMELRLRFFSGRSALFAFKVLQEYGRINEDRQYWLEKVWLPIFRRPQYYFTPTEYAEILRIVIMLEIDPAHRFFEDYYARILQLRFQSHKEIATVREAITEAQDIFKTHRLEPYFKYLEKAEGQVKKFVPTVTKKSLPEIVKEDMLYYKEQRKIKLQQESAAKVSSKKTTAAQPAAN